MTILFWIDFGRIGRQPFHVNLGSFGQIRSDFLAGMRRRAIPDQDPTSAQVPPHMLSVSITASLLMEPSKWRL